MLLIYTAVFLAITTSSSVVAEQARLSVEYPERVDPSVNFTKLFSQSVVFPHAQWTKETWNGITSYAHTTPLRCFGSDSAIEYDIAILGALWYNLVGKAHLTPLPQVLPSILPPAIVLARFGPNGIRQGSRRLSIDRINVPTKLRISDHADVVDCGDVPMVYVDNKVALRQLELANAALLSQSSLRVADGESLAKDGKFHPRVLTLGGDHTITLPLLRGVAGVYGPVSVIHFDSHLDTWKPSKMENSPWLPGEEIPVTHGSYFWYAHNEGLLASNNSNIHVGIRNSLHSWDDEEDDYKVGFVISYAEDIEEVGWKGIVQRIRDAVGDNPVYISLDIDVIDPGMAPAAGTPEIGGFTTREIKKILQGLSGLKVVGADIVEVAPGYDTQDEITQIAAANIGWEILGLMAKTPLVVVIIGGGPAGLVTCKSLLDAATGKFPFDPVVLEQESDIGGTFRYRSYENANLVSSKQLTSFSDFRLPLSHPDHLTLEEYVDYLRAYIRHFNLESRIQLNSKVIKVERGPNGGHIVHWLRKEPGSGNWQEEYKSRSQLAGRRLMILGTGETGMDLAYEAAKAGAREVVLCSRSGFLSVPKALNDFQIFGLKFESKTPVPIDSLITNLAETAYVHPWVAASHIRWFISDFVVKRVLWVLTGTQAGCNQL
ncbi:hypothetical protein EW026_g3525 [Hermanssonia centrifuga]|uniref:Uncharacterized protein n=1 Tax=Hermanssonia centrifuga TaxID=98765 RepID=A0A4V3XAM3_9APHY|nr:hypothetical protein EW026_g3525 [Hermanssonia centrifuga]